MKLRGVDSISRDIVVEGAVVALTPYSLPAYCLPYPSCSETLRRASVEDSNVGLGISSLASFASALFLTVWGILNQCPRPSYL
jgi:hypothetical protein